MKKYTKPSMEIVDLRVEDKLTAPTTFYRKGINVLATDKDAVVKPTTFDTSLEASL